MIGFQSNQDKYVLYNLPGYPLDMLLELKYIIAIFFFVYTLYFRGNVLTDSRVTGSRRTIYKGSHFC